MRYVAPRYLEDRKLTHHALQDALDQAEIFQKMLDTAQAQSSNSRDQFELNHPNEAEEENND